MPTYSNDDQEFFFNIANSILERFHHLDDLSVDIFEVILWYSDEIVNGLDNFIAWKKANSKPKTEGSVAKDPYPRPTRVTV